MVCFYLCMYQNIVFFLSYKIQKTVNYVTRHLKLYKTHDTKKSNLKRSGLQKYSYTNTHELRQSWQYVTEVS